MYLWPSCPARWRSTRVPWRHLLKARRKQLELALDNDDSYDFPFLPEEKPTRSSPLRNDRFETRTASAERVAVTSGGGGTVDLRIQARRDRTTRSREAHFPSSACSQVA